MRVLLVNNFVRWGSGIDTAVALEKRVLRRRGHDVLVIERDNHEFGLASGPRRAAMLASSLYSLPVRRQVSRLLASQQVDVVHLHNLVPSVTGSVYDACRARGAATVQHLHNYRAFCLSSYGYRDGRPCDACRPTAFLACAAHRCYRGSYLMSAGLVAARLVDWVKGRRSGYAADAYIAPSEHSRELHVAHGFPRERVTVLHNAAEDQAALLPAAADGDGAARAEPTAAARRLTFVGSLIAPKGPRLALELAAALPEFEVHFVGTGEDEAALRAEAQARRLGNVTFYGLLSGAGKAAAWADSFLTLVPSLWDEPFGLVVPESYSLGIPVLASSAGGLAETVDAGRTGLRLDPQRIGEAAAAVRKLWQDVPRYQQMRAAAREAYERHFSEEVYGARLEELLARQAELSKAAARRA